MARKSAWLFMKPGALSPFRPTVPPFKVRGRNKKEPHQKPCPYVMNNPYINLEELSSISGFHRRSSSCHRHNTKAL
jgi:hypothetical protein